MRTSLGCGSPTAAATPPVVRRTTGGALLAAAALHVAWGRGSTFPFRSMAELTDNVVGSPRAPSPGACYAVAAGLATTAVLVALPNPGRPRRAVIRVVATVFAVRAGFGFAGRTDLLVPGSSSPSFRRNDRRVFSPICTVAALAIAAAGTDRV